MSNSCKGAGRTSPRSARTHARRRMRILLLQGVRLVWLVHQLRGADGSNTTPSLPPAFPPPPPCRAFCPLKTHTWNVKCGWGGCAGCLNCLPCDTLCKTPTWNAKCNWGGCAGCADCLPAPTPPALPPLPPHSLICSPFCRSKTQPWTIRCNWDGCSGCTECFITPPISVSGGFCGDFCRGKTHPWNVRCNWYGCGGCGQCKPPPPALPPPMPPLPSLPPPLPPPSAHCWGESPDPDDKWCDVGVGHPGQVSYNESSGSPYGSEWRSDGRNGWRFCKMTLDQCRLACVSMGGCAELVWTGGDGVSGCCFPATERCNGKARTKDTKYLYLC